MRFGIPRSLIVLALAAGLAPPAAAAKPAPIVNRVSLDYDVQADGQYTETLHIERQANTAAAAASLAVFPWEYSPSREDVQVVSGYTLKANGRKLPVGPASIRDVPLDPSVPFAAFSDYRVKLLRFLEVRAGDTIVLDLREHAFRPQLPGLFSLALLYDRTQSWDDAKVTVTVPDSVTLQAKAVGPEMIQDGADHVYAWRYHNTDPLPDDPGALAPVERLPRLLVTTATDWQQISRAYAKLALPQAAVTPLVQQTADKQAAGFNDHRAIAEQLFDWVRDNIRYWPVPLGQGPVTPRSADAVLKTHAGDAGDEAVLLSALLAAKGIASDLVLIDTDNVYHLSIPAPFAQLNHVILYLPEFSAYADPTVPTGRIGVLPLTEYGKPAVFAAASGDVLHTIPILKPDEASTTTSTTAHLTGAGMIEGETETLATGPFAATLQLVASIMAADGAEAAAARQLRAEGDNGTGQFDLPPTIAGNGAEVLAGQFSIGAWPHISADNRMSMPDGLRAVPHAGDMLIGSLETPLPADAPTPCFAGRQTENTTLDVGPKYQVTKLPPDRKIVTGAFSYLSHWSLTGTAVTVHREFISRVTQPLCDGKLRKEAAEALHAILSDYAGRVTVQPQPPKAKEPGTKGKG